MSQGNQNTSVGLPPGTQLDNYVIDRKIGGGGFSIVYLAHDKDSNDQVVIKEYMPRKLATREDDNLSIRANDEDGSNENFAHGRRLFFQEASTLATINHPNIINVINFFRAHGTVYMVMQYERGVNLQDYIKRHNGLSEQLIRVVFTQLLQGLKAIHDLGLLHLDIKPGNIYLRKGGSPLLLDFGAVHEMQQSRQFQPTQVITPGFAPIEQQRNGGYVGPWSDLYAIGATMRACIEGNTPPPAEDRYLRDTMKPATTAFKKNYSQGLLRAIDWAMEVDPLQRPQNVDEFLKALQTGGDKGEKSNSLFSRLASSLPWSKG